jgi:hypothetical protein
MADDDAKSLIAEFMYLWSKQGNFRILWNNTAAYVMPSWDNFVGDLSEGVNRNYRLFESTGMTSNERFSAAMEAMLTPRTQVWHLLRAEDEELNERPVVKRWLDRVNRILFAARYHPEANFASQADECYMSLGAFGNNCLFVDEAIGRCLRYRAIPLSELCWAVNHQGRVDSLYRKFKFTAKQALQQWGRKLCPQSVLRAWDAPGSRYQEFEFLHIVKPAHDCLPGAYGPRGMAFESWYIALQESQTIERGGYRAFPAGIGRYRVAPRESYGRGPAQFAFPDIRTSNEMMKTALRAGQKAVDPPILLAEDSVLTNFNQRPGANNYGMVTAEGKPLAVPFLGQANFQVAEALQEKVNSSIRDTFLNTLFQILVDHPNMTATEALIRAQEKGELIAPAMGRQQSEFLGPEIHRELDLLEHAGEIPPPPRELVESGRGVRIEYTSPLARALRAQEGTAIMNTADDVAKFSQIDPSVKFLVDWHEAARMMADIRGTPAKLIRSEAEVTQLLEHAADQGEQGNASANFPAESQGVLNLAKAAQAASAAGGGTPGQLTVPAGPGAGAGAPG